MLGSTNSGSGEQAEQGYRMKEVQRHSWKPGEMCWRKGPSPSETTTGKGMEERLRRGLTIRIVQSRACQEGPIEPRVQTKRCEDAREQRGRGTAGQPQSRCRDSTGVAAGTSPPAHSLSSTEQSPPTARVCTHVCHLPQRGKPSLVWIDTAPWDLRAELEG